VHTEYKVSALVVDVSLIVLIVRNWFWDS
jgi:hypothetical protein